MEEKYKQAADLVAEHGGIRAASRASGINYSTLQGRLIKATQGGYAPQSDLGTYAVPEGLKLKGITDTRRNEQGLQVWYKLDEDKVKQEAAFRAALEAMSEEVKPVAAVKAPAQSNENLLACYPVGDHHFGMLAWGEETGGEDYELGRGEELLCGAMDHLVSTAPECQQAAILILGDFMHYDGLAPVTPTHGHLLDADSRFPKMVRVAIRSIKYLIVRALQKHEHVKLIIEIGNHDLSSAIFLMEMFSALYMDEPRVSVDNSPRNIHCFQFGKNMIGTHHGHKIKLDNLVGAFANDWKEIWGHTDFRYYHTGHVHHDHVKEVVGAVVESHRILAPADAHSSSSGYRSLQSMKAIIYHSEFGEVARHTVNPAMLDAA